MRNTFLGLQAQSCALALSPGRRNRLYSCGGARLEVRDRVQDQDLKELTSRTLDNKEGLEGGIHG